MIGEVLRVVRIANDMKLKDISERANVSPSYLNEIEKKKKKPSRKVLCKIGLGFKLDESELLLLDKYHDSLIGTKEDLEVYRELLLRILETYEEKENYNNKPLR